MKHIRYNILSMLLCTSIISFISCNSEVNEDNIDSQNNLLRITTSINTRSVIESNVFTNEDQIGVFALRENDEQYANESINMQAIYLGNNNWNLASPLPLTNETAYVYAYYPYESNNESTTISININYGAKKEMIPGQVDYLYGQYAEVNASSPEAQLTFKHALARVTFAITRSADDAGSGIVSKVSLKNATGKTVISTTGAMDIKTGTITPSKDQYASIQLYDKHQLTTDVAQNIDILVIPTEISENDAVLELTIDGSLYVVNLPSANWETGKQYTYPITIDRKTAHIIAPTTAKIGDYYYSDGTFSTEYNSRKDCIGIVFALSKEKDGDIDVTLESSEHGRIVALDDASNPSYYYAWSKNDIDVEQIPEFYSIMGKENLFSAGYLPRNGIVEGEFSDTPHIPYGMYSWPTEKNEYFALTDYAGRAYSSYLKDEKFPAGHACFNSEAGNQQPGFWYLPSIGELVRLGMASSANLLDPNRKSKFNTLSDSPYWSSSECDKPTSYAWCYTGVINKIEGYVNKEESYYVRPISSF